MSATDVDHEFPDSDHVKLDLSRDKHGLGVFAKHLIQENQTLWVEAPLFIVEPTVDGTSPEAIFSAFRRSRIAFERMSKFSHESSEQTIAEYTSTVETHTGRREPTAGTIVAIWRNNAFAHGLKDEIFVAMGARVNHSCIPNCDWTFDEGSKQFRVFSTKKIQPNEELVWSYIVLHLPKVQRAVELERYGFECQCEACDLRNERSRQSDVRRTELSLLEEELSYSRTMLQIGQSTAQSRRSERTRFVEPMQQREKILRMLRLLEEEPLLKELKDNTVEYRRMLDIRIDEDQASESRSILSIR